MNKNPSAKMYFISKVAYGAVRLPADTGLKFRTEPFSKAFLSRKENQSLWLSLYLCAVKF
jgi:hypothetical protein